MRLCTGCKSGRNRPWSIARRADRQHLLRIDFTPAEEWYRRARHGFEILGPQARSAVPALIGLTSRPVARVSQLNAIDALGFVGPTAKQAVPALLQWATNTDDALRCCAIFALGKIHGDPETVVPVLTNALQDISAAVRIHALIALQQFGPNGKLAVPALVEFHKTDPTTRSAAALLAIDRQAAAQVGVK